MARVTIEDCLLQIPNRFKIVELAAQRAREIANGAMTTVDGDSASMHKVTVLALKEIANGKINLDSGPKEFGEFDLFEDDVEAASEPENVVTFGDLDEDGPSIENAE